MVLSSIVSEGGGFDDLGAASMVWSAFGGRKLFVMKSDSGYLILPVTPEKYSVTTGQISKTYDLLEFGEALVFGNPKLAKIKFDFWLPATHHGYPYITNKIEPDAVIDMLIKWKEAKSPVRIIITGSPVNMAVAITEFTYREKDGMKDFYCALSLSEYRDFNVPAANNPRLIDNLTNLRGRPDNESSKYKTESWVSKNSVDSVDSFKFLTGSTGGFSL